MLARVAEKKLVASVMKMINEMASTQFGLKEKGVQKSSQEGGEEKVSQGAGANGDVKEEGENEYDYKANPAWRAEL